MFRKSYGIINFSNNCYLNVVIQIFLCHDKTFEIIKKYLEIDNNIINPRKLLLKLSDKINIRIQNDSQEVFILILDLIPDLQKYYNNVIINNYTCLVCNKSRNIKDTFSTFYIHSNSLEDSIKNLVKNENFNLECDSCKLTTNTSKVCNIKNLGEILIFYNILKNKLKISENITYGNNKYKLTGLIKHYGSSSHGHYIYIDYINKLKIDDADISQINNISLSDIYLLFYTL